MLSDINISHSSVAMPLTCGGIYNDIFIANFLLSVTVKEIWKSVIIWQSYGQEFGVLFFYGPRCIYNSYAFLQINGILQYNRDARLFGKYTANINSWPLDAKPISTTSYATFHNFHYTWHSKTSEIICSKDTFIKEQNKPLATTEFRNQHIKQFITNKQQ